MMYFDFRCPDGHVHEALVKSDVMALECPVCGLRAQRQLSAPLVKLEGVSGDFPGAALKWERAHR